MERGKNMLIPVTVTTINSVQATITAISSSELKFASCFNLNMHIKMLIYWLKCRMLFFHLFFPDPIFLAYTEVGCRGRWLWWVEKIARFKDRLPLLVFCSDKTCIMLCLSIILTMMEPVLWNECGVLWYKTVTTLV